MQYRAFAAAVLSAQLLGAAALASDPNHLQPIVPVPRAEQRVEWVVSDKTQTVQVETLAGEQQVGAPEIPTEGERTARKVGKVTLGVVGGALGLASMAAMLLFI